MTIEVSTPRNVVVVTAPAYEPVSLATAKTYCRVDDDITSQDDIIRLLIGAARERAELLTGRAFIERDAQLRLDDLPSGNEPITLPWAPLQYVTYVRYKDINNAEQELSGSPDPIISDGGTGQPGRIAPLVGSNWPATNGAIGNVRIGFRCGYAPSGSPTDEAAYQAGLPGALKAWMAVRVSTFYEQREAIVVGDTVNQIPRDFVDGLLDGLRVDFGFA